MVTTDYFQIVRINWKCHALLEVTYGNNALYGQLINFLKVYGK